MSTPAIAQKPKTLAEALAWTTGRLAAVAPSETVAQAEAERLLDAASLRVGRGRLSRMDLYARGAEVFPDPAWPILQRFVEQRVAGKPLQHLTGLQQFLDHEYEVGPQALIPRPETEVLVVRAIQELEPLGKKLDLGLELGLGSGVISIELLHRFPELTMIASEPSPNAIELAQRNAQRLLGQGHGMSRLKPVLVSDPTKVCEPLKTMHGSRKADFLISNPPYLASKRETEEQVHKHEPHLALFAPAGDPLHFYKGIAEGAADLLEPRGLVFVELPHERAHSVRDVFTAEGWSATLFQDLTGRDRGLVARLR